MIHNNPCNQLINEIANQLLTYKSYMYIFTNPSARAGYDTRSIFRRRLTGLNSEFSFSWTSCLTKAEEPSLSYYLPIAGGRIIVFLPFPRVLVLCEMQPVSSRIWTRVAVSISYDNNHYTTGTNHICISIKLCVCVCVRCGWNFCNTRNECFWCFHIYKTHYSCRSLFLSSVTEKKMDEHIFIFSQFYSPVNPLKCGWLWLWVAEMKPQL